MNPVINAMSSLAAAADTFSAKDVVSTAVTSAQGEMMGILGVVVPAVAAVTVAVVGIKFGISWIKKLKG